MSRVPDYKVESFSGIINRIEQQSLPRGAASDALNWLTFGDRIELRRGQYLMGTENTAAGRVTGLIKAIRHDGVEVLLHSTARKIKYFDDTTEDWIEAGTDIIAEGGEDEDFAFDTYESIAGHMIYGSSPGSSIYKIPVANPGSVVDQESEAHRGKIKIKNNSLYLWDRKDSDGGFDKNSLFRGNLDQDELSDFTETTGESIGTGDGSTTAFTGTLANVTGRKTCMYVRVTDGTETFTDNRSGTLEGNQGGTGTINYATGEVSVTFATAPASAQSITASYYVEDATSGGICDFTKSPTRLATEGFFVPQNGGGFMQNLGTIAGDEYCFHELKTWRLQISDDDTDATNLIYRNRVGIPYWRALQETGDGIYYIDARYSNDPALRILEPNKISSEIEPRKISSRLDLSSFEFDRSNVFEWGDFVLVSMRTKDSSINNRTLVYNKIWNLFDITDLRGAIYQDYNGDLVMGDDGSRNVFRVFDGFDDEDSEILNYYVTEEIDLDVEGVKNTGRIVLDGLIAIDQSYTVKASFDNGAFVDLFTVEGTGDYVDVGSSVTVGTSLVGGKEVGGGTDGVTVHPYRIEKRVNTQRYDRVRLRFEALGIGYVSISSYSLKDNRFKGMRLPQQYQVA